jgi:hypothetical protein
MSNINWFRRSIERQHLKKYDLKAEQRPKQSTQRAPTSQYLQYDDATNTILRVLEERSMKLPFIHRCRVEHLLRNARSYPPAFGRASTLTTYYLIEAIDYIKENT